MTDRRCPLAYAPLADDASHYSPAGLRRLDPRLTDLAPLPFTPETLLHEAAARMDKLSIGGVQPKLSAVLRVSAGRIDLIDIGGRFILKPPNPLFPELPENEDLTMRMAAAAGIEVPPHGLIYAQDDRLCYLIRRFDRVGRSGKLAVEDFAQLLGLSRETKYNASMEKIAGVLEQFCTFPAVEKVKLFRRTLVAYLTGNEDMHVKNFSLLTDRDGLCRLTPAYDLLNSTIALRHPAEELALPLAGKQSQLRREHLVDYFARERLGLTDAIIHRVLADLTNAQPVWDDLLSRSFLTPAMRTAYAEVLAARRAVLHLP